MKKTISVILSVVIMLSVFTSGIVSVQATASVIENALQWAIGIANDDSHGYSQSSRWGPDYDCSSFVISALKSVGLDVGGATYTGNMRSNLTTHDFTWIPWSQISSSANLQRGDILLYHNFSNNDGHTEFYLGNNQNVGAHSNRGYPQTGDQTGTEVSVSGYYYHPWDGVLRYNGGNNPTGCLDGLVGGTGTVKVSGWAFDRDDVSASLNIHVYIGGQAGDSNAEGYGYIIANEGRGDVNAAYGCGDYHGFSSTIFTSKTGTQPVYVYAINVGGGENVCIGSGTVNITADTEKPTVETKYLSQITADSFRVCIIPKDNVGIKNVRIATWTQSDQSDLIWHDAMYNGYGTYFIDLQRSDYSKTSNTIYHNHAYVYDYSGNVGFAGIAMDYRVKSDTGKTINDGEYRIVTSVDESKALDIAGGKNSNGTNIQIYSNINDPNQTFDIQYINDGFYTVFSHSAKKSIDVEGDTYQSGTNVAIYDYHEGANQQWIVKPTDDGYYTIIARSNGLALDLANAKNENGANVQVYTVNNTSAQKWKFRRVIKSEMVNVSNLTIDKNTLTLNPEIQVIVDDNTLVLNKDYKVEVNGDIESGTGTVTVTGIGDYCDSVSKSFEINQYEIGDVNNDGSINITDTTAIQKHIASINTLDENALIRADVNSDSSVDIKDATLIQQYCAGLIDKF